MGSVQGPFAEKKTVCWVSIWDQAFRTTFYFTARSDQNIDRLPIAQEPKSAYRAQAFGGKLKPFTVEVSSKEALGDVFTLLEHKSGSKRRSAAGGSA